MVEYISNPPKARNLMPSLASMGHYSLDAAIADIIDNSITAKAYKIDILCDWNQGKDPYIKIVDNGNGMNFKELVEAIQVASKNPLDKRDDKDLGRFGLGLKTASLSQAKILTVISSKDGKKISGVTINKDITEYKGIDWPMGVLSDEQISLILHTKNSNKSFTEVHWNNLHRIKDEKNKIIAKDSFNNLILQAKRELELIFHRYLESDKIEIKINNDNLIPNDPFLKHKSDKWERETFSIYNKKIKMQTYILPHYSKLNKDELEKSTGKEGYVRNQGFYVYRNKRLIFKGTWFKLASHGDLSKLARVQLDIPNDMDERFKITIDKSYAELPPGMGKRMRGLIDKIKTKSTMVFKNAGAKIYNKDDVQFWIKKVKDKRILYNVNKGHPFIKNFEKSLNAEIKSLFFNIIKHIEFNLPIDSISIDVKDNPDKIILGSTDKDFITDTIEKYFLFHMENKTNKKEILEELKKTAFYKNNSQVIEEILKEKKIL